MTTPMVKTLIDEQIEESIHHFSGSSVPLHEALGLPAYINVSAMPIRIAVTLQGGVRTVELRP